VRVFYRPNVHPKEVLAG